MSNKYLFLDTSAYIQVGLLNEELNWIHYELIPNRKGSQIIHKIIYESMKKCHLTFKDIKGVLLSNGPGSYTGIRIAEGISQVLSLEGIPIYSFYHYEVPAFCDVAQYHFYERAFKGEIFEYIRKGAEEDRRLITEEEFESLNFSSENFYHLTGDLLGKELLSIYELFKCKPQKILSRVLERSEHLPPYYFRPLEKEFRMSAGAK